MLAFLARPMESVDSSSSMAGSAYPAIVKAPRVFFVELVPVNAMRVALPVVPTLRHHVLRVIFYGSEKQVLDIATRWVVAAVANA